MAPPSPKKDNPDFVRIIVETAALGGSPAFIFTGDGLIAAAAAGDGPIFGYEQNDLVGRHVAGILAGGHGDVAELCETTRQKGAVAAAPASIISAAGDIVPTAIWLRRFVYGGVEYFVCAAQGETEGGPAPPSPGEFLLDNLPVGVIATNLDFRVTRWSQGQEIESGISEEQALGRDLFELVPDLGREQVGRKSLRERLRDVITTGKKYRVERLRHKDRFGHEEFLDLRVSPLRDLRGHVIGLVAVIDNITHQVKLEEELAEKTGRLSFERNRLAHLFGIAGRIRERDTFPDKMQLMLEGLRGLGWERLYLAVFGAGPGEFQVTSTGFNDEELEALGTRLRTPEQRRALLEGPALDKFRSGITYYVPFSAETADLIAEIKPLAGGGRVGEWDSRDLFMVGLFGREGKAVGYLLLDSPSENRKPTDENLFMLELFVSYGALVVEEATAAETLKNRTKHLQAMVNITKVINSIRDPERLMVRVLDELGNFMSFHRGMACTFDETRRQFRIVASKNLTAEELEIAELTVHRGRPAWVVANQKPLIVAGVEGEEHLAEAGETGGRSEIYAPVVYEGQSLGCIILYHDEPRAFNEADLEILATLADQVAVALQNARLFEEAAQRSRQLSDLNAVGNLVSSVLDPNELFPTIVERVQNDLSFQNVVLLTVDAAANQLVLQSYKVQGATKVLWVNYRQPIGEGICGRVAATGQTSLISDTSREPEFLDMPFMPPMLSELCVPIKVDGRVNAVLNVESRWPNAFDEADVAALETLSGQIAVALRNSMLMEEVRTKAEELEVANRELKRMDEMKNDFVSMLVHDLRTPMTGILGSSEIVEELLQDQVDSRLMNLVRIIPRESKRMIDLINNILDFYRLDAAGIKVALAPVNVPELIQQAFESSKVIAQKQGIAFSTAVAPGVPPILGDEPKLQQVLSNLVGNALKFTPAGGSVKIYTDGVRDGKLRICVSDTGVGIRPENIPVLFEKFKTGVGDKTGKVRGSGLGLYIARAIVEAHAGAISVESEEGRGSVFVFTIPLVDAAPETA